MIWIIVTIIAIVIFLLYQYSVIVPSVKGLPVLLYHKVSESVCNDMTVSISQLEEQFNFISSQSYSPVTAEELTAHVYKNVPLPEKPILITFDDGYVNNLEFAFPLLKKYDLKATVFLPTQYIGNASNWDENAAAVMSAQQINSTDREIIEYALHSHSHFNYKNASAVEIKIDLKKNLQAMNDAGIIYSPVFAYPYGGRPKDPSALATMKSMMKEMNILLAFRIGNRINKFPITDFYEIKRISISGEDSFRTFKTKLKKGRLKQLS
ncbi:MAG: polysaccharide deacetylase family protein [bacterium]|nr:polysaccharide deacetylase family protein [bacterium]